MPHPWVTNAGIIPRVGWAGTQKFSPSHRSRNIKFVMNQVQVEDIKTECLTSIDSHSKNPQVTSVEVQVL